MQFRYVRLIVCNECRRHLLLECSAKCDGGRTIARVADEWCIEKITPSTVILRVHFVECTSAECKRLTKGRQLVAVRTAELVEKHGVLITRVLQNMDNVLVVCFGMEFTIHTPVLPAHEMAYEMPSILFSVREVGMPFETVVEPIARLTDMACELELQFSSWTSERRGVYRREAIRGFFDCVSVPNAGSASAPWLWTFSTTDYVAWCIREQKENTAKQVLCDAYEKRVEDSSVLGTVLLRKECCDTGLSPCYPVVFYTDGMLEDCRFILQNRGFCLIDKRFYDCPWNEGKEVVARCSRSFIQLSNGLSYVWRETATQCYWTEVVGMFVCR